MSLDRELQLDWDVSALHGRWPTGPDNDYLMRRLAHVAPDATAEGARGPVLEVAAAEALHACRIAGRGLATVVLEPSPTMLARARERMAQFGVSPALVRGICETLPFRDGSFDRVLCDSAIDHFADPRGGIREMARVLRPDGRLIITAVNYGGLSVRFTRALYRLGRLVGLLRRDQHLNWDSPVPIEHSFECSLPRLRHLCEPMLELDRAQGVSLGWMVPGWGRLLRALGARRAEGLLRRLDALAADRPAAADFMVTVWKPRPDAPPPAPEPPAANGAPLAISRGDVTYPGLIGAEALHWDLADLDGGFAQLLRGNERLANQAYTGDPERSWLADLAGRGPFRHAAVLGCDEGGWEAEWVAQQASETLEVYDLSRGAIRTARNRIRRRAGRAAARRTRYRQVDLNFATLPAERYDVIWSSGTMHHIVNLEHLLTEIERALVPGGLFALHDYVGERRVQYSPARLARVQALLDEVPARFRRTDRAVAPPLEQLSPFCAARSDEVLGLLHARFECLHEASGGQLFPLPLLIDGAAIDREAPELAARLAAAAQAASVDPALRPAGAYAVFRKRRA